MSDIPFPVNVVVELKARLGAALTAQFPDISFMILARPLDIGDPNYSIGISNLDWQPLQDSYEFGANLGTQTISRYNYAVQLLVKNASEEDGEKLHAEVSRVVTLLLQRDDDLRSRLSALNVDGSPLYRERILRWGVESQTYSNNDTGKGQFVFLSVTMFFVETETV